MAVLLPHFHDCTPECSKFKEDISGSNLCYLGIKSSPSKTPRGTTYWNNHIFCILSDMGLHVFLEIPKRNNNKCKQIFFVVEKDFVTINARTGFLQQF